MLFWYFCTAFSMAVRMLHSRIDPILAHSMYAVGVRRASGFVLVGHPDNSLLIRVGLVPVNRLALSFRKPVSQALCGTNVDNR
jgi:hypothetical protein